MKTAKLFLTILCTFFCLIVNAQTAVELQSMDVNYLSNGGYENGIAGWKAYKDAAATTPVDGTGGSPTATVTVSTSSPISGKASGLLTKTAANLQGEGIAASFVTDKDARGKVISISGSYEILSGTYSGGTSITDSDVELYVYDVDSSTLIQPAGYKLDGGVTGVTYSIAATFQPVNLTSVNYRLILHIATTSSSAYTLKLDSIKVGVNRKAQGPPVVDCKSFTATGSWVSNTTYSGMICRRGDMALINWYLSLSGAPTSAALTLNMPPGLSIDSSKLASAFGTSADGMNSKVTMLVAGAGVSPGTLLLSNSTTVAVEYIDVTSASKVNNILAVTQAAPGTFASGDKIIVYAELPIVGWGSTVTMSDSADTRVVAALYNGTPTGTLNATFNTTTFPTKITDTFSAYSGGVYSVPSPGVYDIAVNVDTSGTPAGGTSVIVQIYTNGVGGPQNRCFANGLSNVICPLNIKGLSFKAGDSVAIKTYSDLTSPSYNSANSFFSIGKEQGPSQIAASDSVNFHYSSSSGQTLTAASTTVINYPTKDFDNQGSVSAGVFTAPSPGKYQCNAGVSIGSQGTGGSRIIAQFDKNGSTLTTRKVVNIVTAGQSYDLADEIQLNAGDTLKYEINTDATGSISLNTEQSRNYFSCSRTGN